MLGLKNHFQVIGVVMAPPKIVKRGCVDIQLQVMEGNIFSLVKIRFAYKLATIITSVVGVGTYLIVFGKIRSEVKENEFETETILEAREIKIISQRTNLKIEDDLFEKLVKNLSPEEMEKRIQKNDTK